MQKGNAPVERKLQRLFRRGDACRLIKRCNDFGAGGVSVAIGELADGLYVDLDKRVEEVRAVWTAPSWRSPRSQERMAVDVAAEDVDEFLGYAKEEEPRSRGHCDRDRGSAHDNGVERRHDRGPFPRIPRLQRRSEAPVVHVEAQHGYTTPWKTGTLAERMHTMLTDLNVASNKGLSERFDSTIGAGTVLMPFGGRKQPTPNMAMVAKLPAFGQSTTTVARMALGLQPVHYGEEPVHGRVPVRGRIAFEAGCRRLRT